MADKNVTLHQKNSSGTYDNLYPNITNVNLPSPLIVSSNPTSPMGVATKDYVDTNINNSQKISITNLGAVSHNYNTYGYYDSINPNIDCSNYDIIIKEINATMTSSYKYTNYLRLGNYYVIGSVFNGETIFQTNNYKITFFSYGNSKSFFWGGNEVFFNAKFTIENTAYGTIYCQNYGIRFLR